MGASFAGNRPPHNTTKQAGNNTSLNLRDSAAANTKHPELVMRFMDWLYDPSGINAVLAWNGPPPGPLTYGMNKGFVYTEDYVEYYQDVVDGGYPGGAFEFICKKISPFTGRHGDNFDAANASRELSGLPRVGGRGYLRFDHNLDHSNNYYNHMQMTHVLPYAKDSYPIIYYLTPEESNRLNDLKPVINNFVDQEVARFITGANSLDNFDAYIAQLNALGFREYEEIFSKTYENMNFVRVQRQR